MSESGSSPLEAAALLLLLIAPLTPALAIYDHLGNQLAAESVARHGLRAAVLAQEKGELPAALHSTLDPLAKGWGKKISSFSLSCLGPCEDGGILSLSVSIGRSTAIQSAGLEPK